jgi:hypothetical protein
MEKIYSFFLVWPLLHNHCKCTGLPLRQLTPNDTQTRARAHARTHTHGMIPLDEGSARRRNLYLTTHNIHKRQTSMPATEFESTFTASERSQTCALDCAATEVGENVFLPTLTIYTQARIKRPWVWETEFLLALHKTIEFKIITLFTTNNFII